MESFRREFEIYLNDFNKFRQLFEGSRPFIKFDENEVHGKPFDVVSPKNYREPDCYPAPCQYHSQLESYIADWFVRFPKCCKRHEAYINQPWFKLSNYSQTPEKIKKCVLFTEFLIRDQVDSTDWFKNISDYIEYCIQSFGSPEVGADRYYAIIRNYLEQQSDKFPEEKKIQLIEFLERNYLGIKNAPSSDMNILFSTYQKWVKCIPNIGHFKTIKSQVADKFPMNLILYDGEYNPYLRFTKFRVRTNLELLNYLIDITRNVLLNISHSIAKDDSINEVEQYQLLVLRENHLLRQKRLLNQYSKNERKYVKLIKQWLKNEKEFISEYISIEKAPNATHSNRLTSKSPKAQSLEQLIIENEFDEFCDEMLKLFDPSTIESRTVILLKSRYVQYQQQVMQGTIKIEDSRIELNQIRNSLLLLLERIDQTLL